MPDKIFPRGCGALVFLVLIAHILFAPSSAWLGILGAGLICGVLLLLWLAIMRRYHQTDLWAIIHRLPKWKKRMVCAIIGLGAALYAAQTAINSAQFVHQTALAQWPVWAGGLALLLVCWLIARQDVPALFLWALPVAWLVGIVGTISLALSFSDWQLPAYLLSQTQSWNTIVHQFGIMLPAALLIGLFIGNRALPQTRAIALGAVGAALLGSLTVLRASAVLGVSCARILPYAPYAAAGVFELGTLTRSEVLIGGVFFLAMIARITLALVALRMACAEIRKS